MMSDAASSSYLGGGGGGGGGGGADENEGRARTRTMSGMGDVEVVDEVTLYEEEQRLEKERLEREAELLRLTTDSYNELFSEYPTKIALEISRRERLDNQYATSTLSYGEILFPTFQRLLLTTYKYGFSADQGGKFIDIGCGIGTAVFAACLCHQFHGVQGIEILSNLYSIAERPISEKWRKLAQAKHREKNSIDVKFWLGDARFLDHVWVDGDIVFAHWTAFGSELLEAYSKIAVRMKPRSFFISISHKLMPCALFEVLETLEVEMSWGKCVAYVQRRTDIPDPTVIAHPRVYLDVLKQKWLD